MNKTFEELIHHGYELIPIRITPENKKVPRYRGWQTARGLTAAEATAAKLVGVRLRADDLVIDVDPRNGGSLQQLSAMDLDSYPMVDTRSGGWHVYCKLPPSWAGRRLRHTLSDLPGIEFKTRGRFVAAPGSPEYSWNLASASLPPPVVPDFILEMIDKPEAALAAGTGEWSPEQLADGLSQLDITRYQDHDAWFSLMCAAHESTNGLGLEEFLQWSLADPVYALDEQVIRDRWASLRAGRPGNAGPGTLLAAMSDAGVMPPASIVSDDFKEVNDHAINDDDDIQLTGGVPINWTMDVMCDRFKAVDDDGKFRVYSQRRDGILDRMYWVRYDRKNFLETCTSVLHLPPVKVVKPGEDEDSAKYVPRGAYWLDHYKKKETYHGLVYAPEHATERTPDGRLNLWRGFAVRPNSSRGSWERLKELTFDTLCDWDQRSYDYVLDWLARAVQRPWEAGGVALVFKGMKGTGKSTLGRFFVWLFGRHGMQVTSQTLLTGRFNAHLRDISALFADEAFWAGDKGGEGVLKGLVTEGRITFEGKGTNAEVGRNCVHLMMASNEEWVVPAGIDGERRFAVFQVAADTHDASYWAALHAEMRDGGMASMLAELLARDISSFNVFAVPQTTALIEQKIKTLEPIEAWLYDMLDSGKYAALPALRRDAHDNMIVLTIDLQDSVREFYRMHNKFRVGLESMEKHLGAMLHKMLPSVVRIRVSGVESRPELGDRPYAYQLPDIVRARQDYTAATGIELS